jgi:hypothetical protein
MQDSVIRGYFSLALVLRTIRNVYDHCQSMEKCVLHNTVRAELAVDIPT